MEVDRSLGVLGELELNLLANLGHGSLDAESREGLEWQDWVGCRADIEEWCREGQDLGSLEGGVEWRRSAILSEEARDQGLVAGLDGDDGSGSREVGLVIDERSLVEVGTAMGE